MRTLLALLAATVLAACSAAPSEPAPPPTAPAPTVVATTAPPAEPQVETVEDVLFATAVDEEADDQELDISYLSGSSEKKPVIVWASGNEGSTDRTRFAVEARALAAEGFVVLSFDYNPKNKTMIAMNGTAARAARGEAELDDTLARFRELIEDGECALRYAAETAEQYGGDPERVIWAGYRNGAALGSLLALGDGDIQTSLAAYAAANDGPPARVACVAAADPAPIVGLVGSGGMFPGDYWLENDHLSWWTAVFAPLAGYAAIGNNPDLTLKIIHPPADTDTMYAFEDAEAFTVALQEAGYDAAFIPGSTSGPVPEQMVDQIRAIANQ